MSINFLSAGYPFTIPHKTKFKAWVHKISIEEAYNVENIDINVVTRKIIVDINKKFLRHNYPTDIITFDYSSGKILNAELFICLPVVRGNSKTYKVTFEEEFVRVVFHGILHLMKYDDHTDKDVKQMRAKEDYYLRKLYLK